MKPKATKIQQEYAKDFYAWALHNAALIRSGKFSEVDIEHVAEEIESMGRSDKSKLTNRLGILMTHLLKWQYQPNRQSRSWLLTIKEQRIRAHNLLRASPSLKYDIEQSLENAYEIAVIMAAKETGLEESVFPKKCPFSFAQCLNSDFLPEKGG
jgi:hypothetical protein